MRRKLLLISIVTLVVVTLNLSLFGFLSLQRSAQGASVVISVSPEAPLSLQRQLAELAAKSSQTKVTVTMQRSGEAVPVLSQSRAVDLYITATPEAIAGDKQIQPLAEEELVLVINPLNPVRTLATSQLKQMLRGEIKNWQAIGGPDRPITWLALPKDDATSVWLNIELGRWPLEAKVCPDIAALKKELAAHSGAMAYLPLSALGSPAQLLALTDNGQPFPMQKAWYGVVPRPAQAWWERLTRLDQLWHHQTVMAVLRNLQALLQPTTGAGSPIP